MSSKSRRRVGAPVPVERPGVAAEDRPAVVLPLPSGAITFAWGRRESGFGLTLTVHKLRSGANAAMKIHEYQAKEILAQYGVPVPRGSMVTRIGDVRSAATALGGKVVVKAQIHAGGRGKGRLVDDADKTAAMYRRLESNPRKNEGAVKGGRVGGVRLANSPQRATAEARKILGRYLVTHQTGPEGKKVQRLLIEEQLAIADEYYAAILIDAALGQAVLIVSSEGGQAIEEVAAKNPKAIVRLPIDPEEGLPPYKARAFAKQVLKMPHATILQAGALFSGLYKAFVETDATMIEINPFVITAQNRIIAADAKVTFDDNADFRQPHQALRDKSEEDAMDIIAEESGIGSYIKLEGNIGCMVNGAGLAMATLDTIVQSGGAPANFLDIGTVNQVERVVEALRIINMDKDVKAILVNIFGGMARVDIIAEGVILGVKQLRLKQPIVLRLNGSNLEEGLALLDASGMEFITADDLGQAARKAVAAAAGN